MERIVIEFLEKQEFTYKEQEKIKNFFLTKKFSLEGQVYLVSLIAYTKRKNLNKIFMFFDFLWKTTWKYIPIYSRANLTINPVLKKHVLARKERRYFNEMCNIVGLHPLGLKKLQGLWKEDFEKLPSSVKNMEFKIRPRKKKEKEKEITMNNLSPEEKLLRDTFGGQR